MHVLVSGANRGLGLGLVKELLKFEEVKNVYATHRHWADISELMAINDPRLHVIVMELMDNITIGSVYVTIRDTVCNDGLNCIINNAAVFESYDIDNKANRKAIMDKIEINSVGPMIMCQSFLPQLRKAVKGGNKAMIVNISDELASMEKCKGSTDRKAIVYQMSKTGMNMMARSMAADANDDGVTLLSMTTGHVRDAMGGQDAETTVDEAAKDIIDCVLHKIKNEHTGGFYDRKMNSVPF